MKTRRNVDFPVQSRISIQGLAQVLKRRAFLIFVDTGNQQILLQATQ